MMRPLAILCLCASLSAQGPYLTSQWALVDTILAWGGPWAVELGTLPGNETSWGTDMDHPDSSRSVFGIQDSTAWVWAQRWGMDLTIEQVRDSLDHSPRFAWRVAGAQFYENYRAFRRWGYSHTGAIKSAARMYNAGTVDRPWRLNRGYGDLFMERRAIIKVRFFKTQFKGE